MLKKQGFFPILVNINWEKTTISENTKYFLKEFRKTKAKEKYILGFSFGAMIAFLASTKVNVTGLMLCSLSPYFKEDLLNKKRKLNSPLMLQRYQDFSSLNFETLVKQIKAKQTFMFYGKKETKPLIRRVTDTFYKIPSNEKYLIKIKHAEHNISDYRYLKTIHDFTKILN